MRKGLNGDLDRSPMVTWIMFLKFLDDLNLTHPFNDLSTVGCDASGFFSSPEGTAENGTLIRL